MKLSELFEQFYQPMRLLDCSPRTAESYHGTICLFARLSGGDVEQLSDELVCDFLGKLLADVLPRPKLNGD